jgi:hypothetical protein
LDDVAFEYLLPIGCIPITDEEAQIKADEFAAQTMDAQKETLI